LWKVEVIVRLKQNLLDPQGKAVEGAMNNLGYVDIENVRAGKFFEFDLTSSLERKSAELKADDICSKLLANPVIEDYNFTLTEVL